MSSNFLNRKINTRTSDSVHATSVVALTRGDLGTSDSIHKFGEVSISGAQNNIDVWDASTNGVQPEPVNAGYQPTIKSTSSDDSVAGIGLQSVKVIYLDTNGDQQSEDVLLNGTGGVVMVATDVQYINSLHGNAVGSNLVSVGRVCAYNGATMMICIPPALNHSVSTSYQVPAGHWLAITSWAGTGTAGTSKEAILRLRSTSHDDPDGKVTVNGVYHVISSGRVKDTAFNIHIDTPVWISPLAVVKVSAWTTGTINISASWSGWLEPVIT